MTNRKNWVELLTTKAREDKATNLTINNIPLIDCVNVLRDMRCEFLCHCGGKGNKTIRNCIEKGGMFCKECTNKTKSIKTKATCLEKYGGISPSHSQIVRDKIKATNLQTYGVEHPQQSQIVRDKTNATCLERYGAENPLQSQLVKDKIKATNVEKYGFEHPLTKNWVGLLNTKSREDKATNITINNIPLIDCVNVLRDMRCEFLCHCGGKGNKTIGNCIEKGGMFCKECTNKTKSIKTKATCLEKYGGISPSHSQIVRDKTKATCLEKYGGISPSHSQIVRDKMKATNLQTYGVSNGHSQIVREKIKATCLERYGAENPMQNEKIFEKAMKNRFKRKPYTFKSGETIECQGYEPWALKDLEDNYNYTYEDYMNEPDVQFWYDTNDGKKHRYHKGGDIPLLKENKLIEVKSPYTFYKNFYVNLLKSQCVLEKGYDFEFWVYDNKKELSIIDSKFMTNKFIVNSEIIGTF